MLSTLKRALPYLLLFPAFLPLVYTDGLLYPYLTPKTLLFRADFIFLVSVLAALALSGERFYFSRLRSPITWIPATLLASAYLSSLFGIDFYHSFWSIFDRGDGLLTLTGIVTFFYGFMLAGDEKLFVRLIKITSVIATLVAIFALLQWIQEGAGINIPLIPGTQGARVGSTLGNAAFLASYLGMTLFATLALAPRLASKWQRIAYLSVVLQLLAILASATRGTLLALVVAGFATVAYVAWRGSSYRVYAHGGLVALLVIGGLFFAFRSELTRVPFAPVARLASISTSDTTVESRLFIWQSVGAEALKTPLFGIGAENIQVLFDRVYDPTAIQEQWFDRTHNAFLDYFVQYGIIGFALFCALIAAFAREALRAVGEKQPIMPLDGPLFLLLILVYAVQNLFIFDTAVTLWLLFALFALLCVARGKATVTALALPRVPEVAALALAGLIALFVIPVSITPLRANLALADGYVYHVFDARRATASMEKGYALGSYADLEYGYQLYEMYTERQMTMLSGEARVIAYRFAAKVLSANYERYSYDARTATYYAHTLDSAPPEVTRDDARLNAVIEHAIELSPKRIQPRYLLANQSIRKGDALPQGDPQREKYYRTAIQGLEGYAALVPTFAEPRYVLATLYLTIGEKETAAKWAAEGLAVYKPDEATARRASRYYVIIEDWEHARRFLADTVALDPSDVRVKYDLAKAEFLSDNVARAKQLVEELKVEAPGLAESDPAFMKALEKAK